MSRVLTWLAAFSLYSTIQLSRSKDQSVMTLCAKYSLNYEAAGAVQSIFSVAFLIVPFSMFICSLK